ncbi:uncharacterized protein LOC128676062 [Plodia interpunctella]|uniref:uncharacterized protein LOC128676062 n=1 Tax=Plodia interpunctella TaxID=58824 RepID=UPI002368470F|nr:uncharacterized protein LOC128676062 [Plodia interpunctella]
MRLFLIFLTLFLKLIHVENRMIRNDVIVPVSATEDQEANYEHSDQQHERVIGLKNNDESEQEEDSEELEKKISNEIKKQCAIVVLSNLQNQEVRSLLRKYRYNADGSLIPSSVKYYIKLPQNSPNGPVLVPLNDKAFSPMGGFVRYYKEVPPIPRTW